jgi:hypothetical protein
VPCQHFLPYRRIHLPPVDLGDLSHSRRRCTCPKSRRAK